MAVAAQTAVGAGRIRKARDYTGLTGQLVFYWDAIKAIPAALQYRKYIAMLVSDMTIGVGALVVGAGTFFVIFSMAFFTAPQVGLEWFQGLRSIAAQALTGL